jgi:cytoskeletal protein RodZ
MAGTIGIKIANGDFYPITGENSPVKKRLVLTTVHDRQKSVQIDLFRSISKSMLDAQYIGSLVIENIRAKPRGDPSIEMVISSDINGNITADAYDLDSGSEHQTLNVSLRTLDSAAGEDDFPDFNLDEDRPAFSSLYDKHDKDKDDEEKKFPWLIMGLATLFVVIAVAILWFLFFGGREMIRSSSEFTNKPAYEEPSAAPPVPPPTQPEIQLPPPPVPPPQLPPAQPETQLEPPPALPPQVEKPQEPPVIKAPSTPPPERAQAVTVRTRPPAPVSSYKVPAVIPPNGVVYQIRWGDTLWEISEAFYRDPWLYPKIARDNNLNNPDHIISGKNVKIRPLN